MAEKGPLALDDILFRTFGAFGVTFTLASSDPGLLVQVEESLRAFFPARLRRSPTPNETNLFRFERNTSGFRLISPFGDSRIGGTTEEFIRHIRSLIRATVASKAAKHIFIHAGVVAVAGRALVIPADSHAGKTTLVRALIAAGAEYYSDEYAVIDRKGMVLPFAKPLSVRGLLDDAHVQTEILAAEEGCTVGTEPLPLGWVLLTRFEKGGRWRPRVISSAEGTLLMIPHVIGLADRPKMSLRYLETALEKATIFTTVRGDAGRTAEKILQTLVK